MKFARASFVWFFTGLFAFTALLGEGLHFLPGLGHDGCCSHECCTATEHDSHGDCHSYDDNGVAVADSHGKQNSANSAANCAICQYFAQAKPIPVVLTLSFDYIAVSKCFGVYTPLLTSQSTCAYQSRAPPCNAACA